LERLFSVSGWLRLSGSVPERVNLHFILDHDDGNLLSGRFKAQPLNDFRHIGECHTPLIVNRSQVAVADRDKVVWAEEAQTRRYPDGLDPVFEEEIDYVPNALSVPSRNFTRKVVYQTNWFPTQDPTKPLEKLNVISFAGPEDRALEYLRRWFIQYGNGLKNALGLVSVRQLFFRRLRS